MKVTQNGNTTTVVCDGNTFKVTYNSARRCFVTKLNGRAVNESRTFQEVLNDIADRTGEFS